ncbi:MAG: LysM peptidoglycan-binding domain-containing protein [Anaerovoracaceae bacterium]
MRKKYRITSKFRFTLFATVLLLCLFTLIGTISGLNTVSSSSLDQYYQVQVQYGDTLWDIAAEYGPADRDIRSVIWDICEINGISAEQLTAGQRIIVPVYQ